MCVLYVCVYTLCVQTRGCVSVCMHLCVFECMSVCIMCVCML